MYSRKLCEWANLMREQSDHQSTNLILLNGNKLLLLFYWPHILCACSKYSGDRNSNRGTISEISIFLPAISIYYNPLPNIRNLKNDFGTFWNVFPYCSNSFKFKQILGKFDLFRQTFPPTPLASGPRRQPNVAVWHPIHVSSEPIKIQQITLRDQSKDTLLCRLDYCLSRYNDLRQFW